jgi:hypothetical protein
MTAPAQPRRRSSATVTGLWNPTGLRWRGGPRLMLAARSAAAGVTVLLLPRFAPYVAAWLGGIITNLVIISAARGGHTNVYWDIALRDFGLLLAALALARLAVYAPNPFRPVSRRTSIRPLVEPQQVQVEGGPSGVMANRTRPAALAAPRPVRSARTPSRPGRPADPVTSGSEPLPQPKRSGSPGCRDIPGHSQGVPLARRAADGARVVPVGSVIEQRSGSWMA